jgi:hypothetical protein
MENQLNPTSAGLTAQTQKIISQEEVHEFRKQIDACIQVAKGYKNSVFGTKYGIGQRENALVLTKLQEAKMWCGKILEEVGSPFPENLRDEAK